MMNIQMGRWRTRLARRSEKPRTVVRLHPVPPVKPQASYHSVRSHCQKNFSKKTGKRGSTSQKIVFLSCCFIFMPPHIYKADVAAGNVPFLYISTYIETKTISVVESFYIQARLSLFFTLPFSKYILLWRGTQVAQGDPLLRGQAGNTVRGFESRPLRQKRRSTICSVMYSVGKSITPKWRSRARVGNPDAQEAHPVHHAGV